MDAVTVVASPSSATGLIDPFASAAVERITPTNRAQRAVWRADRLGPEASLAFSGSSVLELRGVLDARALTLALDQLVARHESLRATFSPDGLQLSIHETAPLALTEIDLSHRDTAAQQRVLAEDGEAAMREHFALQTGPLFRAALYKLSPLDHVLLMTAHQAVCDGWSWRVIVLELGQLYANQTGDGPALAPAPPCGDYVAWEANEAARPGMPAHTDDWLARSEVDRLPALDLPLDRRRPTTRSLASRRIEQLLDRELESALRKRGAASGHSLIATLFGGFAALLHRLTGQDDLVIGNAAAGQFTSGMPGLVGHCVHLRPIRVAVDGQMPFGTLVSQVATLLLHAPRTASQPTRSDAWCTPRASVLFDAEPDPILDESGFPGLTVTPSTLARPCDIFELALKVTPSPDGLQLQLQYDAGLFDHTTVRRWLSMLESLLRTVAGDATCTVAQLTLLSASEMQALLALQPPTTPLIGTALMHAGFGVQAASHPRRPALRHGEQRLGYGELDQCSNRMARALRARGVQRGQRVGLCLPRGVDLMVALLAVLKAGAACVALDPEAPTDRLHACAGVAGLTLLLTDSRIDTAPRAWRDDAAGRVFEIDVETAWRDGSGEPLVADPMDALPQDPACILFVTDQSDAGAQPRGVCVPHGAVANLLQSMQHAPSISADDKFAAISPLSEGIALLEWLLPLTAGAEIVIVPPEVATGGRALAALLQDSGATMMQASPGVWRGLVDAQWQAPRQFRALVGGGVLANDLASELVLRCAEVWALYGHTETTLCSTVWHVSAAGLAARGQLIGRPIANTSTWIVDRHGQLCPIGVAGEICIGGKGVATGYLDEAFGANRFLKMRLGGAKARLYRTGDLGRWRNDGLLERLPGQVSPPCSPQDAVAPAPAAARVPSEALLLPEQAELAQLWASALDIDVHGIRATDNFFELGGDPALALRVTQQAQKVLGFRIDPGRYAHEDLARLASAALATEAGATRSGATDRPGLLGRLFGPWARVRSVKRP
jgi:amino acid adenylation domain-containing protein